jgi:hypothetical protein
MSFAPFRLLGITLSGIELLHSPSCWHYRQRHAIIVSFSLLSFTGALNRAGIGQAMQKARAKCASPASLTTLLTAPLDTLIRMPDAELIVVPLRNSRARVAR